MTLTRNTTAIGLVAAAATFAILALGNFVAMGPGEDGGLVPFLVTAAIAIVAWLAVFGWYAPRARRPAVGGLVAGVFGLVAVIAFWSGLPVLLGGAGIALGTRGRDEAPRAGAAAIAAGSLAVLAAIAATAYDRLT